MSHKLLIPFLTAGFLVTPAVLPSVLVSAMGPGFSGAAQASKNLNSSRSNIYRTAKTNTTTPRGGVDRMGGGGGARGGGALMGGGGGQNMGGGGARMGGGGGGRTK